MTAPQITRAVLIPMLTQDGIDTDTAHHLPVQFNPATLRVTLANTLKADSRSGGGATGAAAQYIDKSESTLAVELVFDTSVAREGVAASTDVRLQTQRIAAAFMQPQDPGSARPRAPRRCRFQWGRFQFTGMVSSYTETLDFFAPEGIPLRATLALTLKEDRYQFDFNPDARAGVATPRPTPTFTPAGPGTSAADAARAAGLSPLDWRVVADANRLDNPRLTVGAGAGVSILVPVPGDRP